MQTEIVKNERVAPEHYLMQFVSPEMTEEAKPGQFVHIRIGSGWDPLLRRPISLHRWDRKTGVVTLLYRVVGRGTRLLAAMKPGEQLDVMGPLGRGFDLTVAGSHPVVVGGGIGVAPLLALVEELSAQGAQVTILIGARTRELALGVETFQATGSEVEVVTEDGSLGHAGLVTERLRQLVAEKTVSSIYTCGPVPMLKEVQRLSMTHRIPLQVAVEEHMGCGVGACLTCVCKVKRANTPEDHAPDRGWDYALVCTEGPVFRGEEVSFDD